MQLEEENKLEEAKNRFLGAWNKSTTDFERFTAAHYIARHQKSIPDRLKWLETGLQLALRINDDSVKAALPPLYSSIAKCHTELGNSDTAKKNQELADKYEDRPTDNGPFFHGTKANLQVGDLLKAGGRSNYKSELVMNHIYFTALVNGAGLAAALAKGDEPERVYIVQPTGSFENDPNVTNKKFPGNPTRSYRSQESLNIIGEITDWAKTTPEERQEWQEKLAKNKGEIIN